MDLVPETNERGDLVYRPLLGGSFFTVALGLGRLGCQAGYLWELAEDTFGAMFRAALAEAGVDLSLLIDSTRATPVAVVDLGGPEPRYLIADPEEVMRTFAPPDPAGLPARVQLVQSGSAILALEPVGTALETFFMMLPERIALSVDYNVRTPSISDRDAYAARLERLSRRAAIVKASAADLAALHGACDSERWLERRIAGGASLAVVTNGPAGVLARSRRARAALPAPPVAVVDTVGAGDGFTAGLLAGLAVSDRLSAHALREIDSHELHDILARAQRVAAFVCASKGARMPWRAELTGS